MSKHSLSGRPWSRLRRAVIATSDVCCICGGLINKKLRWPHPMSASVDHRIPLVLGGHPTSIANLGVCHLSCNSGKGGRDTTMRTSEPW